MDNVCHLWILTLFPDFFSPLMSFGVVASALRGERGTKYEVHLLDLKTYSPFKYKNVDDSSFGGGPGMVMRPDILKSALDGILMQGGYSDLKNDLHVVYTSPRGKQWTNEQARNFAHDYFIDKKKDLVFICGRYEGVDERFVESYVDEEFCIGDFVLSGGELAIMTILDSALRFVPGTLGNSNSADKESFEDFLLDHPHYTKPVEFEGKKVPDVLFSGHHANIEKYRLEERVRLTKKFRADLLEKKGK